MKTVNYSLFRTLALTHNRNHQCSISHGFAQIVLFTVGVNQCQVLPNQNPIVWEPLHLDEICVQFLVCRVQFANPSIKVLFNKRKSFSLHMFLGRIQSYQQIVTVVKLVILVIVMTLTTLVIQEPVVKVVKVVTVVIVVTVITVGNPGINLSLQNGLEPPPPHWGDQGKQGQQL